MGKNYNSNLQTNNTDLQAILNTINELPEAGGDPVLQDKTVTPTTSKQTVTADSGYDGLDTVTVNAMPTATQATPTVNINSSGLITASATQSAGYVTAGTKSATKQLTTQAAKTITPSTSSQTAVASGRYTTGTITVAAIPSTYVKPSATKSATTYTPTTSNQTIAAGTYCSGAQTIKGDANLKAANIAEGVTIFGITGTHKSSEDLESVISQQETLIAELSAAVDGKASGGGANIQTATVTISLEVGSLFMAGATLFKDGAITDYCFDYRTEGMTETLTIENVALGSLVVFHYRNDAVYPDYIIEGGELIWGSSNTVAVKVTNTTCSVTQYDAD